MLTVKTPDEAFSLIKQEFTHGCLPKEYVPLKEACGRVLSADILADSYVPDFDRSTVDGYAVSASDTFGCSDSIPPFSGWTEKSLWARMPEFCCSPDTVHISPPEAPFPGERTQW